VSTGKLIQSQLEAAGFATDIYTVATAAAAGTVLANGFADMGLIPRVSSPYFSQTLAWYTPLLGPVGQNGSLNWSDYDDAGFNALVEGASQNLSSDAAAVAYGQADDQLWDDMVGLPLFVEPTAMAWSRTIGGIVSTPDSDSLLWYAQYWAIKVPEPTSNTTPSLPGQ
jgi:ABC-type transport system substrate-binding protein